MRTTAINSTIANVRNFFHRLRRNNQGVAAVEFAMITPMLLMLLIGTLEAGTAYTIDRRVSVIASSVADLISRSDKTTNDEMFLMTDKIARSLIEPYDFDPIKVHIVSIKADPDDATDIKVHWSCSYSGGDSSMSVTPSPYNPGSDFPAPAGLMAAGTSLIATEVTYDFTPFLFTKFSAEKATGGDAPAMGAYQMREIFYLSPRTKSCVSLNGGQCITDPPHSC